MQSYIKCPVFDVEEPLFVFANVYYRIENPHDGDPERFAISTVKAAYPPALREGGVRARAKRKLLIDDFSRGWQDWYVLEGRNRHHWHFSTRKPVDPRWKGQTGDTLAFEVQSTEPGNTMAVRIVVNAWRGHLRKKRREFVALVRLAKPGWHTIELSAADFREGVDSKIKMESWEGITELGFRPADKALKDTTIPRWKGNIPGFRRLRWFPGDR